MFPYRLQTYTVENMFTSFTISHVNESSIAAESDTEYIKV